MLEVSDQRILETSKANVLIAKACVIGLVIKIKEGENKKKFGNCPFFISAIFSPKKSIRQKSFRQKSQTSTFSEKVIILRSHSAKVAHVLNFCCQDLSPLVVLTTS